MPVFFTNDDDFLIVKNSFETVSDSENYLTALKDEKQKLLDKCLQFQKSAEEIKVDIKQTKEKLEASLKMLSLLQSVLSATDKNVSLDQTFLKSHAWLEKKVRMVLKDIGRTPRKHANSFNELTRFRNECEVSVKEQTECMQNLQNFLDVRLKKISTIINLRLPLVNQRISQTELEIAQQCLQSILNDSIAPMLNKFS